MGMYAEVIFKDSKLEDDIYATMARHQRGILLTANKDTIDYLVDKTLKTLTTRKDESACSRYVSRYNGHKILCDNSLRFGEIEIYLECP